MANVFEYEKRGIPFNNVDSLKVTYQCDVLACGHCPNHMESHQCKLAPERGSFDGCQKFPGWCPLLITDTSVDFDIWWKNNVSWNCDDFAWECKEDCATCKFIASRAFRAATARAEKLCEAYFNLLCEFLDEDEIRKRIRRSK